MPSSDPKRGALAPFLLLLALLGCATALAAGLPALAGADEQEELEAVRSKIEDGHSRRDVLTTDIERLTNRVDGLENAVAALRGREANLEAELAVKEADLSRAEEELADGRRRLRAVRAQLRRALIVLRERLVSIYESGQPDVISVLMSSENYGDLATRSAYLESISNQDESVVERVGILRDQAAAMVARLKAAEVVAREARNEIAERKAQLVEARAEIESEQSALRKARGDRKATLDKVDEHVEHLEDIAADLQAEIQQQLAEAGMGGLPMSTGPSLIGPSGLMWPANGAVTSGFGYRWGRMHEGVDIALPEGTPLAAAADGRVILAAYTGGYGNYTCVDHGAGLSTCYAHQSSFAVSPGQSVTQGQTIGYSGNTGSSTGPHLHFEIRVNGEAVDPFGYL